MRTTYDQRREAAERIDEITQEIEELADEALDLIDMHDRTEGQRARAYWYAQIRCALNDDHEYLGGGSHTMADAGNAIDPDLND